MLRRSFGSVGTIKNILTLRCLLNLTKGQLKIIWPVMIKDLV